MKKIDTEDSSLRQFREAQNRINDQRQKILDHHQVSADRIKEHSALERQKLRGEEEIKEVQLREKIDERLLKAIGEENKRLRASRENFEQFKNRLNEEQARLKKLHRNQTNDLKLVHEGQFQDLQIDSEKRLAKIQENAENKSLLAKKNARRDISNLKLSQAEENYEVKRGGEVRLARQAKLYETLRKSQQKQFERELASEFNDQKKELDNLKRLNTEALAEEKNIHEELKKKNAEAHQNMIKDRADVVSKKHETLIARHQQYAERIKETLEKELAKVIASFAEQKKAIESKGEDPFYRISKLDIKIDEAPDHYIFSLPLPEHEKENVSLDVQKRDVKIALTRRYNERIENQKEGKHEVNESGRSELFKKSFQVGNILDSSKISRRYENGILSFKVIKA